MHKIKEIYFLITKEYMYNKKNVRIVFDLIMYIVYKKIIRIYVIYEITVQQIKTEVCQKCIKLIIIY